MICRRIEDNEVFNGDILGICVHLWNSDNDFREDLDIFDEEYVIIDENNYMI